IEKNLIKMSEIIEKAIIEKAEIVVFPELSLTGYLLEDLVGEVYIQNVPEKLLKLSEKIAIIFGAIELGKDNYTYNTAYYLEDGEVKGKHRKVYLPTYGLFDEGRYVKPGNKIRAFDTKFGKFGILICEDAWHQSSGFILSQDGAEKIFILVNSPARGFGKKLEIEKEWNSLIHSIAITNVVNVIMCNRVGVEDGVSYWGGSTIISPSGKMIYKEELFKEKEMLVEIDESEIRRARLKSPVGKNENLSIVISELKRIEKEQKQY
ncbi:MAG: nitrilase-related carbon-nitrogen hydrolase, partial [Fusobacteriaceae bacterium]